MIFKPITFLIVLALSPTALSAQLLVPTNYPTIQSAVDAAMDGDEILVAPGVYRGAGEDDYVVDLLGKSLTLRATGSEENTIIDGDGTGAGIIQRSGAASTWIEGFTIRNARRGLWCSGDTGDRVWVLHCTFSDLSNYGLSLSGHESAKVVGCQVTGVGYTAPYGSIWVRDCNALTIKTTNVRDNETFGLVIDNSIALVRGCEIARNGAYISGPDFKEYAGGMTGLGQSQITVEDCQISENRAKQSGGIRISGGVLEMSNCSVFDNIGAMGGSWGVGWGAGVYVDGGELSMLDCQVYSNRANWPHSGPLGAGGGICVCDGTAHLERCVVEDNQAGHAGGLELSNAVSTLVECRIHGNSADSEGGGVRVTTAGTSQASLTLTRCEVDGNASTRGAGVFSRDAEIIVNECEVTDNYATERGGGWFVTGVRGSVVVQDSEIRGNLAWDTSVSESQSSGGAIFCEAGSSAEVARCEFKWNYGQYAGGAACVSGASLDLIESMFHDHFAGNLGGTILIENGGVMEMARCMVMSGNTDSGGSGGGLYVAAGSSNTARVEASTFCGNEVGGSMHNVEPSDIQNIVGPWTDAGGNEIRDWCVLSVDDDGADDPDAEFASIQQALEVLPEYWDIEVHPGRYVGTGNEVVNIDSRGRGTRIVAVAGPEFTVIDGEGARCGVRCLGDLPEEGLNAWATCLSRDSRLSMAQRHREVVS